MQSPDMEETIAAVGTIISKWDLYEDSGGGGGVGPPFINKHRKEAEEFIAAVQDLHTAMEYLVSTKSPSTMLLVQGQHLLQAAMNKLQKEFFSVLKNNMHYLRPGTLISNTLLSRTTDSLAISSSNCLSTMSLSVSPSLESSGEAGLSIQAMNDLKMISDCMISSGYGEECVSVYKITRKSVVDEDLYHLGISRSGSSSSSSSSRRMNWEAIELEIKRWLNAVGLAVKTTFNGERILCEHVFSAAPAIQESCFSEITRDGARALFDFPNEIAGDKNLWKKSPERIFRVLDLYEAIVSLRLDLELIFSFDSTSSIRLQAESSLQLLGGAVKLMIKGFESAIHMDSSKTPVPGGGLHPLVRYVMNFLVFLSDYDDVMSGILADWPLHPQSSLPESYFEPPPESGSNDGISTNVCERFAWLILVLLCKIEGKAERYRDFGLKYLFMANNLQYVVGKVRSSNLQHLLGGGWLSAHEEKVSHYVADYESLEWSKVTSALNGYDPTAEISMEQAKQLFERFNNAFDEVRRRENVWVVADRELREEIRALVARNVVPAYRNMYEKCRGALGRVADGAGVESAVRLAPEDVEKHLLELLSGAGGSGAGSASPLSSDHSSPSHFESW
ncbi:hypothetical protein Dimus_009068 [Dionaea muscipula]